MLKIPLKSMMGRGDKRVEIPLIKEIGDWRVSHFVSNEPINGNIKPAIFESARILMTFNGKLKC